MCNEIYELALARAKLLIISLKFDDDGEKVPYIWGITDNNRFFRMPQTCILVIYNDSLSAVAGGPN